MKQTNYEAEIKILSEFIKICEKMLRQSAGMPNKEKSILNRLERCKTRLNIILACATVTTIHQKAEKLSKQISELERQIHIDSNNVISKIKKYSGSQARGKDVINNSEKTNLSPLELFVNNIIQKGKKPIPSLFDCPAYLLIWSTADSIMSIVYNQEPYYISFKDSNSAAKVIQCLIDKKNDTKNGMATVDDLLESAELALSDPQVLYNIMTPIRRKITVNCVDITGAHVIGNVKRQGKYFITTHKDNIINYG